MDKMKYVQNIGRKAEKKILCFSCDEIEALRKKRIFITKDDIR